MLRHGQAKRTPTPCSWASATRTTCPSWPCVPHRSSSSSLPIVRAIANRAYVVKDDDCDDVAEPGIEYASTIVREGYTDGEIEYIQNPYVIAPEELGENEEYDIETLIYYADEKLTDDDNRLVEDVENLVGVASLSRFGEYENDSVCVRNDRLKTDYEILLDVRRYSDVVDDPHQAED